MPSPREIGTRRAEDSSAHAGSLLGLTYQPFTGPSKRGPFFGSVFSYETFVVGERAGLARERFEIDGGHSAVGHDVIGAQLADRDFASGSSKLLALSREQATEPLLNRPPRNRHAMHSFRDLRSGGTGQASPLVRGVKRGRARSRSSCSICGYASAFMRPGGSDFLTSFFFWL